MSSKYNYNYKELYYNFDACNIKERKYSCRKHVLRQVMVNSLAWMTYFMSGLTLGAPAVFIPQLRKLANSDEFISPAMASWLSSASSVASMPWIFVLMFLSNRYGRRFTQMLVCVTTFGGFFLFYCSENFWYILISEVMMGSKIASTISTVLLISAECSSPKYRGIFLAFKTGSFYWGIWIANVLGTYFHYKYIPLLGMFCAIYSVIVAFWSESPYWLASNGRIEESIRKLVWLNGIHENSKIEIKSLVDLQTNFQLKTVTNKKSIWHRCISIATDGEFYKPALLAFCAMASYHLSGKLACSVYAIQIIKKITYSESTAYKAMLLLDGICVISMYVGSVLSRYLKRRTLFFCSAWSGILCLFILTSYLYLIKYSIILENSYITISILASFFISSSLGVTILCTSLLAELMPMKFKSSVMCVSSFGTSVLLASTLKITPFLFDSLGSHGAFLFFGCTALIFTFILVKYLPETKDKSLREISDCYIDKEKRKEFEELHKSSVEV